MSSAVTVRGNQPQLQVPLTFYQPFKAVYVALRLLCLLALLPAWTAYYSLFPRPRKTWTLKETVNVRLIRWIMPINAACGTSPLRTDKTRDVPQKELKETSFLWLEPVDSGLIKGFACDDRVHAVRVPAYLWPKGAELQESDGLVGLWIHGGGYMMGNASESFPESAIPRAICQNSRMKQILSVDYRLTCESCHPAQLLDALAAYSYLVKTLGIEPNRVIIFGACAGGHLVLMLMRYLYEEKVLPLPAAMMLFSPWVDMAIDKKTREEPSIARPNMACDLLATSYQANLLFLGHHSPDSLSTPYLSANLAPPDSYVGYPRTFISVGDAEAFQRECDQLAQLLQKDGVDVTYDVQQDAVHDFWGCGELVPSSQARERLSQHVYEWLKAFAR